MDKREKKYYATGLGCICKLEQDLSLRNSFHEFKVVKNYYLVFFFFRKSTAHKKKFLGGPEHRWCKDPNGIALFLLLQNESHFEGLNMLEKSWNFAHAPE